MIAKRRLWIILISLIFFIGITGYWFIDFQLKQHKQGKIARFSQFYAITEQGQPQPYTQYFLFGDSRAQRWPSKLYPFEGEVFNAGIGGDVTVNMLWRLPQDVLVHKPSTVVLLAGINDIVTASLMSDRQDQTATVDATIKHLTKMIELMTAENIHVIAFTITPPLKPNIIHRMVYGNTIDDDITKVNAALQNLASDNVTVLDSLEIFKAAGDSWAQKVRVDALHFSDTGYELLKQAVLEELAKPDT